MKLILKEYWIVIGSTVDCFKYLTLQVAVEGECERDVVDGMNEMCKVGEYWKVCWALKEWV